MSWLTGSSVKDRTFFYRFISVLSFMALLVVWAFSSLPASYPDEPFHMVNTYCAGHHPAEQCDKLDEDGFVRGPAAILDGKHWWWENPVVIRMADYRADNYSPGYYRVTAWLTTSSTAESIARVRLFNALFSSVILVGAFAVSHRSVRCSFVLSFLLVSITYGFYFIASNHPLSWAFSGVVAFSVLFLSSIRHSRLWQQVVCGLSALCCAIVALSARRESAVALAFATIMAILVEYETFRGWLKKFGIRKLLVAGMTAVMVFLFAIGTSLVRPIYPFNSKGVLLFTNFDPDRFVRNVWATPVVFLRVLAGTRDDNSLALDPFGYWLFPTLTLVVLMGTWMITYAQSSNLSKIKVVAIVLALLVNILAPVVYITPRPFDLLGPNLFPTRYLLLLFVSALFFIGIIFDFDGNFSFTTRQYALISSLIFVSHGISLYHNFIPKGSQDIKLTNIGRPGAAFEGWWFESISPMSVWIVGLAASLGLLVGIRRAGVIRVAN